MADPVLNLTMTQEELDKMLPALRTYKPSNIEDDISYIKTLCMACLEDYYTRGAKMLGQQAAIEAIDTDLITAIKARNLI